MLTARSGYDLAPYVESGPAKACTTGWRDILARIRGAIPNGRFVVAVECYPGALVSEIAEAIGQGLRPALVVSAEDCYRPAREIDGMLAPVLTDDPVFGKRNGIGIDDFLDPEKVRKARAAVDAATDLVTVVGCGATLVAGTYDLLIYANLARWQIQQRQRAGRIGNLGADNASASPGSKYKRAFFVDWRAADRLKETLYGRIDFLLDANDPRQPRLISGADFRAALHSAVGRPLRLVPFFDPGPWGGNWMRTKFGLPDGPPNYAWGFDCVPEENSLLLGFGDARVEVPALDLVLRHPRELLGDAVFARFGAEFPIRFDLLDTMGGGNLSLQVHPLASYIERNFGMAYTQDESYYLLDAGKDATVYLGLKEGVDRAAMARDLRIAETGVQPFDASRYVNAWPARKHDHFLIPAGTIHCSGRDSLVLEISATPYIFTFKLWDWARLGLNGLPRPIHLRHGLENIQWERTAEWVRRELINHVEPVAGGQGWQEERTGLHALEFIETRRHWFRAPVRHDTAGTVNVLNLVEGDAAIVESPDTAFAPMTVHYAETFIVPAAVGPYVVRPETPGARCGTIKAYVRN